MADFLNNLELLEKEVAKYRSKFQKSSELLNDLAKIQLDFGNLAQKYQELQEEYDRLTEHIDEAKTVSSSLQAESKSAIEAVFQTQETIKRRFLELKSAIETSTIQVRESLAEDFANLETATDRRWDEFCDRVDRRVEEIDRKIQELENEFAQWVKSEINSIKQVQASTAERCTTLEERLSKTEQSLSNLQHNTRNTRRLAYIIAVVGSILVVCLAVLPFWLQARNKRSDRQVEPTQILKPDNSTK